MKADLIVSDECVGCGACVKDCPMRVIELRDGKAAVHPKKILNCIGCQHCVAVCPKGAVSFGKVSAEQCKSMAGLDLPSPEQIDNLMVARRSIRQYQRRNIERTVVEKMLSVLANSPTGCNAMGLTFSVVNDFEKMAELRERTIETMAKTRTPHILPRFLAVPAIAWRKRGYDEFFRNAPNMLIVSAGNGSTTPEEDCAAALAYFSMIAAARGIGTTWCGYLRLIAETVPEVRDVFGIPRGAPFAAMLFGYPQVRYFRTVNRSDAAAIKWL